MPTNVYKIGNSYYRADNNQKILNPTELAALKPVLVQAPAIRTGAVPIPNPQEIQNYNVTNRMGGTLYGTPKTTIAPKREGADILVPTSQTNQTGLEGWKSGANLVEAARSIIQMKQGYNKDIQTAKQVWTEKARDTSAWGDDKKVFAQMSPSDQASIRAKQYAVAESHLSGLSDEEKYRGVRTEDTLKYVSDIYTEKIQELDDQKKWANEEEKNKIDKQRLEIDKERNRLLSAKDRLDLGIEPTPQDIYGEQNTSNFSRIGFKEGGTLSWRSNNPGNIKFGDFAKKYGAVQGAKGKDGGYFAIFPDEATGKQAMMDLLKQPSYQNLSVDAAMKRWSNSGYGAEIYKGGTSLPMSKLSEQQLSELAGAMIKREGWKEGKTLSEPSSANNKDINYLSSLTGQSPDTLKALNLSKEELDIYISIAESDKKKQGAQELETEQHVKLFDEADAFLQGEDKKGTDANMIYGMLVRQYSPSLTIEEIKTIMTQNGHRYDSFINSWD